MKNFRLIRRFFYVFFLFAVLILPACTPKKPEQTPDTAPTASSEADITDISVPSGEAVIKDVDTSRFSALSDMDNSRVFYHIFVGSFSDSNGDGTGDLRGIINRLDYINDGDPDSGKSLGAEGIWLSPIFKSPSYHKYDTTDYYTIDPSFGTMEDLKELASECDKRGIKLILDLVINHTGSHNQWFVDFRNAHVTGDTASPYYNFYSWNDSGSASGRSFAKLGSSDHYYECNFSGDMPELNFDNPLVYDAVLDIAKYYLNEIGVDGFRFDAAKYVYFGDNPRSVEFWKKYMEDLRAIKPGIFTVAEVWDSDSVTSLYEPALDCFNFTMAQADGMISSTTKKGNVNGYTSYTEYYINNIRSERSDANLIQFIANHDMDRAAGYMTYSSGYAKMAASLYLLAPGSSFIYYGEEIGMKGSRGSSNTDANRRLAMLWGDDDTVRNPVGASFDSSKQINGTVADMLVNPDSLYNHYKRLIMIRRANPEIASGEYHALVCPGTNAGGFVSTMNGSAVAVFHNTTASVVTIDLSALQFTDGSPISSLLDTGSVRLTEAIYSAMTEDRSDISLNGTVLTLPSQSTAVLR